MTPQGWALPAHHPGRRAFQAQPRARTCREITQEDCHPLTSHQGSGPPRVAGGASRQHPPGKWCLPLFAVASGNQLYFLKPPIPPLLAILPKDHLVYLSPQSSPFSSTPLSPISLHFSLLPPFHHLLEPHPTGVAALPSIPSTAQVAPTFPSVLPYLTP